MSLDVYLSNPEVESEFGSGIFIRENGSVREISREEWDERFPNTEPVVMESDDDTIVYSANITHNLGKMASEAGIYEYLWRSDELNIVKAYQLIDYLEKGLTLLKSDPERFKKFNPSNGWGSYDGLVEFTENYLQACKDNPNSDVSFSR